MVDILFPETFPLLFFIKRNFHFSQESLDDVGVDALPEMDEGMVGDGFNFVVDDHFEVNDVEA